MFYLPPQLILVEGGCQAMIPAQPRLLCRLQPLVQSLATFSGARVTIQPQASGATTFLTILFVQQFPRQCADFPGPGAGLHLFGSPKVDEEGGCVGVEVGEVWKGGIGQQVCSKTTRQVLQQLMGFISDSTFRTLGWFTSHCLCFCVSVLIMFEVCGEYIGSSQPHPCRVEKGIEDMVVSFSHCVILL